MAHQARKRFGQHFLVDRSVIGAIVAAIHPARDDLLVEIGPGLGALTTPLLARVDHLHVVEIDHDVIAHLKRRHLATHLTIHEGDALEFDFSKIVSGIASSSTSPEEARRLRVCGNLPYNISTPLLFHLSAFAARLKDGHFMLQKEVIDRMVAEPGSKVYGRLSVMLQVRFAMESLFDVPPDAFDPPPKVDSAIVRMLPRADVPDAATLTRMEEIVTLAFSQRRKMLRATLGKRFSVEQLNAAGIDATQRAEDVTVGAYLSLARLMLAEVA